MKIGKGEIMAMVVVLIISEVILIWQGLIDTMSG